MSVQVFELAKSRKRSITFDGMDVALNFIALGSNDDTTVYAAVKLLSPATYTVASPTNRPFRLRRKEITLDAQGAGVWLAECSYGFQLETADDTTDDADTDDATPAGPELSFDTTGGTQHITQSLGTISKTGPVGGAAAQNYKQAINVTRDGVGGTDIIAGKLEFTLTVPKVGLTRSYVRDLARNTGRTNSKRWQNYEIGEVLFMGASGSAKPGERFTVVYKFAVQENRTGVVIRPDDAGGMLDQWGTAQSTGRAGEIAVDKKGWEFVWCSYKDTTDVNMLIQIPAAAYVEKVYRSFDFKAVLGF